MTNTSVLTKNQKKTFFKTYTEGGELYKHTVTVRYDDECGNGHNSFSITSDIRENGRFYMGGCCHDEIRKHFPELAPLIKWHLMSSDEPMHYIANTLYWLGYSGWCDGKDSSPPNLEYARSTAVWPDMPESFVCDRDVRLLKVTRDEAAIPVRKALENRRESLQADFRAAVESLGFTF